MSIQYRSKTISNGNFVPVPMNVMRASKLTVQARLLFALLNAYAMHGNAFPSRSRLSNDVGVGERQIADYIKELKDAGLITTERRGLGKTNLYFIEEITVELLEAIGTNTEAEPVTSEPEVEIENDLKAELQNSANQELQDSANLDRQNIALYKDIKEKDIKPEKKKEKIIKDRAKKTADEISIERVEKATNGEISWEELSNRDFALFFIREHNERFPTKPLVFDKYSSVGLIRDGFIGFFNLKPSEVCEFMKKFLKAYSDSPDNWGGLTWGMIAKNPTLLKRVAAATNSLNESKVANAKYKPRTDFELGFDQDGREIW